MQFAMLLVMDVLELLLIVFNVRLTINLSLIVQIAKPVLSEVIVLKEITHVQDVM